MPDKGAAEGHGCYGKTFLPSLANHPPRPRGASTLSSVLDSSSKNEMGGKYMIILSIVVITVGLLLLTAGNIDSKYDDWKRKERRKQNGR